MRRLRSEALLSLRDEDRMLVAYSLLLAYAMRCSANEVTFTVARQNTGDFFTTGNCLNCSQFDAFCVEDKAQCCKSCICRNNGTLIDGLTSPGFASGKCIVDLGLDEGEFLCWCLGYL